MLVLYYIFFKQYCDETKFKDLEMDVASAENNITDCIRQDKLSEWSAIRKEDCGDNFEADSLRNFFPRTCCSTHSQLDEPEPGVFKEEFRATEMICLCSKTYCCFDSQTKKTNLSSKGLNKHFLNESSDGSLQKYRKVLNDVLKIFFRISEIFGNKCVTHLFLRNLPWSKKKFLDTPPWRGDPPLYNQTTRRTQLRLSGSMPYLNTWGSSTPGLIGSSITTIVYF